MRTATLFVALLLLGSRAFANLAPGSKQHKSLPAKQFVYVASGGAIFSFKVKPDGTLAQIPTNPKYTNHDHWLVADPIHRSVYSLGGEDIHESFITPYRIPPTGILQEWRPTPQGRLYPPGDAASLVIDPSNRFAYMSLGRGAFHGGVGQYRVGPNGFLKPLSQPLVHCGDVPDKIVFNPAGPFLYVTTFSATQDRGGCAFYQYRILPNGTLKPLVPFIVRTGAYLPVAMTADQSGRLIKSSFQYLRSQTSLVLPANPSTVHRRRTIYLMTTDAKRHFAYAPSYRQIYDLNFTKNRGSSNLLAQFRIMPSGLLRPLRPATVRTISACIDVAIDPESRFAYVVNGTGFVLQYRIMPNGVLKPLKPSKVKIIFSPLLNSGVEPLSVVIVQPLSNK